MPTLWTALRSRWLDSDGGAGMDRLVGFDRLNEHLRRDIGLPREDQRFQTPTPIRDRSLTDARSFLALQAQR